ncbi:MAG: hypothetical protein H0W63_01700 [Gemmatimonadaceae bacterium]|nr:hypothetical protein [Gemmatimonadaceae bacterium]
MSLDEAALLDDVRSRLFAPSSPARTIGAELELIPIHTETHAAVRIDDPHLPSSSRIVRRVAERQGWREASADGSAPSWDLPDGARISFEPGGQIEISSAPQSSCSGLIASLQNIVSMLSDAAAEEDIELLSAGADPYNGIDSVPLQLAAERYLRMTRYLAGRGEFGIRMMRQTAALQISVEHGPRPLDRWRLLNALAPYIIAIFANSPRYGGRDTGHASYRTHFWRNLDESRTGIPFRESDPAAAYTRFALGAGTLRAENGAGEFHPFASLLHAPETAMSDWHFHLSTLFPEIRPKEYFEVRSADAIAASDLAAPLVFVTGLVYDDDATMRALDVLGAPDEKMLVIAGRDGLRDNDLSARAREVIDVAIEGASRLPDEYLSDAHKEHAARWLRDRVR